MFAALVRFKQGAQEAIDVKFRAGAIPGNYSTENKQLYCE
jgi:hypothetical protein